MTEKINWSILVDVASGPKLSEARELLVEAYDKIAVSLDAGQTGQDVELQPGAAGRVELLLIKANKYDPDITYSPDGGTTKIPLEAPLMLIGADAVKLLKDPPDTLQLDNNTGEPVQFEILIGRDATP